MNNEPILEAIQGLQSALIQQAADIKQLRETCERIIKELEEMQKVTE